MKKLLLVLFCVLSTTTFFAQSKDDIAKVYIKRANIKMFTDINPEEALLQFNKAMKYMDTITKAKVAWLGTRIHYELGNLNDAHTYAKQYFLLAKNKKTDEYIEFLDLFITIEEEIEQQQAEEKRLEEERIKKEKELRKIDSLKNIWHHKANLLSINADSIYKFNKNNVAVFSKNEHFGILNDKGTVLVKAEEYKDALPFDGYILLMNKTENPTKIYAFNTQTKQGFLIPNVSDFNPISTNYGKVMLPRGNGRLVCYPNNSLKTMVYDLGVKKFVKISNQKELLKTLKKTDKIDKYNKDGQVKIHKKWYNFGGHIGGGIHPLYNDDYSLYGFLCSIDGRILTQSDYNYLGAFYNGKSQVLKGDDVFWVNQNGTKVKPPKNEDGVYKGGAKVKKADNGKHQIMQNGFIILGDQKLEKMADFLRKNSKKE